MTTNVATMLHYRLYLLEPDGHIRRGIDLECRDDEHALEMLAKHPSEDGKELWQRTRFVTRVEPRSGGSAYAEGPLASAALS